MNAIRFAVLAAACMSAWGCGVEETPPPAEPTGFVSPDGAALAPSAESDRLDASVKIAAGPLDPACLEPALVSGMFGEEVSEVRIAGCRAPEEMSGLERHDGWITWSRPKAEDGDYSLGFISMRKAAEFANGAVALQITESGGGSGRFSYGVLGAPGPDGVLDPDTLVFESFGDRCNGGIASAEKRDEETLRVRASATPADLAAIALDAANALESPAARLLDALPFCATCCAGEAVYDIDVATGEMTLVGIGFADGGRAVGDALQGPSGTCLREKVAARINPETGLVARDDLAALAEDLAECPVQLD